MYFLADIGATKIKIGLSKNLKKLDKKLNFDTVKNYDEFLQFLENIKPKKIQKACFGFPGVFDKKKERLIFAPHLQDFENKNVGWFLKMMLL